MKVMSLFLSLLAVNSFAQDCTIEPNMISAQYEILSHTHLEKSQNSQLSSPMMFELHRQGNRVLQRFSNSGISNIWSRNRHERISLVRAFEEYQQAIEYQANELNHKVSWHNIHQPIPVPKLAEMTMVSQHGEGCQLEQHYRLALQDMKYQVTWLPKLNLVSYYQATNSTFNKQWQLTSYKINSARSASLFSQYTDYNSTDYADVGDNESIPFLAKMIHQGFSLAQTMSHAQHSH